MRDPYSVLGVSRDATDEEIKKAYRNLSRKYHPDANVNNPNKEQAEERFKEVQQAYDKIMNDKQYGGSYGGYSTGGYGNGYGGFGGFYGQRTHENEDDIEMQAAANYIRNRYYKEALNLLNRMEKRTGRWYYFSAVANHGVGNNVIALEHAKTAVNMEPSNVEYRQYLQYIENGGSWYRDMGSMYQNPVGGVGKWCINLLLLNLFCNLCCCPGGAGIYYQ